MDWIGLGSIALYQLLEKFLKNSTAYIVGGLTLLIPIQMAAQNWTDHSRAGRYVAPDSAYNLLQSVAKNGILFTNGDNDTFPLWYIQEVEGVRTDVRVLCLSYVNTDWYIDQMYKQMNESPALPLSLKREQYVGQAKQSLGTGQRKTISMSLPVDRNKLLTDGIISEKDLPSLQAPMKWEVPTRGGGNTYLELKDVLILNLLENVAKGGWERPVYFANTVSPGSFLGLSNYLRLEGLAYRVLPVKRAKVNDPYARADGYIDIERMDSALTSVFRYRNLAEEGVYYDENIQRMLGNYYNIFYRLSDAYLRRADNYQGLNNRLRQQLTDGSITNADSLNAVISANQNIANASRNRAKEVMLFADAKFPYTVTPPDPFLLARAGVMLDRIGEKDLSKTYLDYAEEKALGTLNYYYTVGEEFPKAAFYYSALQVCNQHYGQQAQLEQAAGGGEKYWQEKYANLIGQMQVLQSTVR
ncbi:MAG: hypothetical protein AAF206_16240 [Bacteroidota bacterium]